MILSSDPYLPEISQSVSGHAGNIVEAIEPPGVTDPIEPSQSSQSQAEIAPLLGIIGPQPRSHTATADGAIELALCAIHRG